MSASIRGSASFLGQGPRPVQEDHVLSDPARGIFVLADGFGGGAGVAVSKSACEAVKRFLYKEAGDRDATLPFVLRSYFSLAGNVLFNALIFANRAVNKFNKEKNVHEKGGTSVIAGYLDGDLLALANVGVCSAVLIRDGESIELVLPRGYGRMLELTRRSSDVPLMALGMSEDLEPEICEYRLREGDWLIFYSDGVAGNFLQDMKVIQQKQLSPQESIDEAKAAFENQELKDNASTLLVIF